MKIATGSFVGNGKSHEVSTGFRPDVVYVVSSNAATATVYKQPMTFSERTNPLDQALAFQSGLSLEDDGFVVMNSTQVNGAGDTIYWLALADNGEGALAYMSWFGNGLDGRVVPFPLAKKISALIIKRDSAQAPVAITADSALGATINGSGTSNTVALNNDGSITVANNAKVNELFGTFGEGISGTAFYGGVNSKVLTWTGNGVAGRAVSSGLSSLTGGIVWAESGSASARIFTSSMPSGTAAKVVASALTTGEITISGGDIVLSNGAAVNANGTVYHAVFFGADDGQAVVPAAACKSINRKAIYLPGRNVTSYINCGNSDATLKIDGPLSIQFVGTVFYTNTSYNSGVGPEGPVICRGAAGYTVAPGTGHSWGLSAIHHGSNQGWCGPLIHPVVSTWFDYGNPAQCGTQFRSGIWFPPMGKVSDIQITHNGAGRWIIYIDGRIVKERNIDMTNNPNIGGLFGPNIQSGAGHYTGIGGRWNGTSWVNFLRMLLCEAAVYNVELTAAEVAQNFKAYGQLDGSAGVTRGLAERWTASTATVSTLPATVNAANNGMVVGGSIVTL